MSSSVEHNIQTYILELVHDQLTRRQPLDSITRNLLKLLTVTCGYSQIRLSVSHRLEMWLQNPKVICVFIYCNSNINILVMICIKLDCKKMKKYIKSVGAQYSLLKVSLLVRILCYLYNFFFFKLWFFVLYEIFSESSKFCQKHITFEVIYFWFCLVHVHDCTPSWICVLEQMNIEINTMKCFDSENS